MDVPHRRSRRLLAWTATFLLAGRVSLCGGFIVLPFLVLQLAFVWLKKLYRWLEGRLWPERVAARAAELAQPSESRWVSFGGGSRRRLAGELRTAAKAALPERDWSVLTNCSYEERHSRFPGAKLDIVVFDSEGRRILHGRKPLHGAIAFWPTTEA